MRSNAIFANNDKMFCMCTYVAIFYSALDSNA